MENIEEKKMITGYNFLVLMDFSESSYLPLKYAITIAKTIGGQIHVAHISNPEEIVTTENQRVGLNALKTEAEKINAKLSSIVEIIIAENVQATYHYSIGNIIHETKNLISEINSDLIIIGKKKSANKFSGKLSNYLVNNFDGAVLIIDKDYEFMPDTRISLGFSNNKVPPFQNASLIIDLAKHTIPPLTMFTVKTTDEPIKEMEIPKTWTKSESNNLKIVSKSFQNSSIVKGIIEHASEKKNELLCLNRGKQKKFFDKSLRRKTNIINEVINDTYIPILIMGRLMTT